MRDRYFLMWLADRLVKVYGESENVDFVLKLRAMARATDPERNTPNLDESNALWLTISEVQAINLERANRWHNGDFREWSVLEWSGALCGEAGELANVCKKLRRIETGAAGNAWSDRPLDGEALKVQAEKEAADTFLYLCLTSSRVGFNLSRAVQQVFNMKSEEMGFPERL